MSAAKDVTNLFISKNRKPSCGGTGAPGGDFISSRKRLENVSKISVFRTTWADHAPPTRLPHSSVSSPHGDDAVQLPRLRLSVDPGFSH
jgi:hypothetical protein